MNVSTRQRINPERQIAGLLQRVDVRANSLIITIFGDALLPRGGAIWLGDLITLMAPFGISERLVRTGVYRLAKDGWVASKSEGRRAHYSITEVGNEQFNDADQRIYSSGPVPWDGQWRLVHLLSHMKQSTRQSVRSELGWAGFGQISPNLFAHPTSDVRSIDRILKRNGAGDSALAFTATTADFTGADLVSDVVRTAWNLEKLNAEYDIFINTFAKFSESGGFPGMNPAAAFSLRTLLIHEYRRLLLKDPVLPDQLLPTEWKGTAARNTCAAIYRKIATSSESFLEKTLEPVYPDAGNRLAIMRSRFTGQPTE